VRAPQLVSRIPTAAETAISIKYAPRMLCAPQYYAAVMLPWLCELLGAICKSTHGTMTATVG
jgi:hypothetical protein